MEHRTVYTQSISKNLNRPPIFRSVPTGTDVGTIRHIRGMGTLSRETLFSLPSEMKFIIKGNNWLGSNFFFFFFFFWTILLQKVIGVQESKQKVTKVVSFVKNSGISTKCLQRS